MSTKKTKKAKGANDEALNETINAIKSGESVEGYQHNVGDNDDLEKAFEDFEKNTSNFVPEVTEYKEPVNNTEETKNNPVQSNPVQANPIRVVSEFERNMKAKMFLGFCCFLLSGFNVFLFNKIRGTAVPFDKMILNADERSELMVYMDDPNLHYILDKIPGWAIGIAHVEYMMFQKHAEFASEYKKEKKEDQ